jgi:hypothetical protein
MDGGRESPDPGPLVRGAPVESGSDKTDCWSSGSEPDSENVRPTSLALPSDDVTSCKIHNIAQAIAVTTGQGGGRINVSAISANYFA